MTKQDREPAREYTNRESHCFKGQRYLLKVIEEDAAPYVVLKPRTIELHVRPGSDIEKRKTVLDKWYREQLKARKAAKLNQMAALYLLHHNFLTPTTP